MARRDSLVDDLVLCPWWVSGSLAVASYLILPGLLPAPFRPLCGVFCWLLAATAILSVFRAWKVRRSLDEQTGLGSLRALPWKAFEDLLGQVFRRQGYQVEETLGGGADGGVDLVLRRNGEVTLVQCKRWKNRPVPVQTVRELFGVLHDRHADAAKLVATTRFTSEAADFAGSKPIELIDQDAVWALVRGVQCSGKVTARDLPQASPPEPSCPRCGREMKLRTARRGANAGSQFWGCSFYRECRGSRPLVV